MFIYKIVNHNYGMIIGINLFEVGLLLVFIGFILIITGFFLLSYKKGARGGGIVLIGPFPIVWGTDKEAVKWLLLISLIFILFYLFLIIVYGGFRL